MEQPSYPTSTPTSSGLAPGLRWWTEIIGGAWVLAMVMVVMAGVFVMVMLLASVWVRVSVCPESTLLEMGLWARIC